MKGKRIFFLYLFVLIAEIFCFIALHKEVIEQKVDTVAINEILWEVKRDWNSLARHENHSELEYSVIDNEEKLLYQSNASLNKTINDAVVHQDTILDIVIDNQIQGKLIVSNQMNQQFQQQLQSLFQIMLIFILLQIAIATIYFLYIQRAIILPFSQLRSFAQRVAYGNLDIPLHMDRKNVFGAFSEAFDLMRSEIKQARMAEAKANESKKELIAKLSHDIKTPLASIKAASEVGAALSENDKNKANYLQIMQKSDQINHLINDLFTASLEELQELSVAVSDVDSSDLKTLLENADYKHQADITELPLCRVSADRLRLQQVFDNIFANSYKYAQTAIIVNSTLTDEYLIIAIEDYGGGVDEQELLHLKEKYVRGKHSTIIEGAGLGLYIADYLMKMMKGALTIENGKHGFLVKVFLSVK